MSKEFKAYRFFVMIYVVIIANFAVLISEGATYYIWFLSSIVFLFIAIIKEKAKIYGLIKHPGNYRLSRECIYLIVFIITYPRHYMSYKYLNYSYVAVLQLINILLFVGIYCVKEKAASDNQNVSDG